MLANTTQWPILIVCYTNHALDQFLEGILKFCDTDGLVRIGGKSQCEALEKYNLSSIKSGMKLNRKVPTFIHNGRFESNLQLNRIQGHISDLEKNIEQLTDTVLGDELRNVIHRLNPLHLAQLNDLANGSYLAEGILNWLGHVVKLDTANQKNNDADSDIDDDVDLIVEAFEDMEMDEEYVRELEEQRFIDEESEVDSDDPFREPPIRDGHAPFRHTFNLNNVVLRDDVDADGFQIVKNKRKSIKNQFKREIQKTEIMSLEQAKGVRNINTLLPEYRWNLYRLWIKLYVQKFEDEIKIQRDAYRIECLRFNGLRKQEDIEIVKKAKIIGMTTTGAAKYRHIIDGTKPTITSNNSILLQNTLRLIFLNIFHLVFQLLKKRPKCLRLIL